MLNNRYSLFLALPILIAITVFYHPRLPKDNTGAENTVNAVIGDQSYVAFFGKTPDKNVPDFVRIRTHLLYVEQVLRERPTSHLSPEQRKSRVHNLALLDTYIKAGKFPHNDGSPKPRSPVFMDEDGNLCAVGYLLEQTAGRHMVRSVNKKYKYAYINEINDPVFDAWARKSGFTKRELAMIQPAYGPYTPNNTKENRNHLEPSYALGSSLLASANILYWSNRADKPWFFASPKISNWFGLAAGTGSVVLGILNVDNTQTQQYPYYYPCNYNNYIICATVSSPITDIESYPSYTYTQTNHLRTGVSIANMAVGLISIIRSSYHLMHPKKTKSSQTAISLTNLQNTLYPIAEPIPALKFRYDF